MKKLLSVILCGAMVLSVASCSSSNKGKSSGRNDSGAGEKPDVNTTEVAVTTEDFSSGNNETESSANEGFDPEFTFETTDRDGNVWNEQSISSNKLTMINFWEPWCGPCVGEIPDLERLYENYKDKGFVILGVYEETSMENDVAEILNNSNVTYPILHYTGEFDRFQTGYVPTTILIDSTGHVITMSDGTGSVIGSKSYAEWESLISKYL